MPVPRRLASALLVLALTPLIAGAGDTRMSLARLSDSATTTKSIATDTLDPPTSLGATGGISASLTWTATVDTYAAGYELQRAAVSGGPYAIVATITPRSTVAATDTPASSGTYYYVLRSSFQNWRSVNSNQASAVVTSTPVATGYHACTGASNAADTGGDGDGYETNAGNACASDGSLATDANSGTNATLSCTDAGKDAHRWWNFTLGVPATAASVAGIQVRADEGMGNNAGTTWLCVQLSWNAGTTWTAAQSVVVNSTGVTTYNLGGATDTWGRTWSGSDFSNANFRVRVIDVSDKGNKDFRLDYLAVQVSYYP